MPKTKFILDNMSKTLINKAIATVSGPHKKIVVALYNNNKL